MKKCLWWKLTSIASIGMVAITPFTIVSCSLSANTPSKQPPLNGEGSGNSDTTISSPKYSLSLNNKKPKFDIKKEYEIEVSLNNALPTATYKWKGDKELTIKSNQTNKASIMANNPGNFSITIEAFNGQNKIASITDTFHFVNPLIKPIPDNTPNENIPKFVVPSENKPGQPTIPKPKLKNDYEGPNFVLDKRPDSIPNHRELDTQQNRDDYDFLLNDVTAAVFDVKNKWQKASQVKINEIEWINKNIQLNYQKPRNYQLEIGNQLEYDDNLGYLGFYWRAYFTRETGTITMTTPWTYGKIYGFQTNETTHYLSLDELQKKTSKEVQEGTKLFEARKNNFVNFLKTYSNKNNHLVNPGIDFINYIATNDNAQMYRDFSTEMAAIGYYGDWGQDTIDKIKYSPDFVTRSIAVQKQEYVANITQSTVRTIPDETSRLNKEKINNIIKTNPFGFLPSNIAQMLHYLSYDAIANIFNKTNVTDVQANFDDEKGIITIVIVEGNQTKTQYVLKDTDFHAIKKIQDFFQYTYERSFFFEVPIFIMKMGEPTEQRVPTMNVSKQIYGGTGWIFDRLVDPIQEEKNKSIPFEERKYQFLAATNLHVLDWGLAFNKYHNDSPYAVDSYFNLLWNGGLWDRNKNPNINSNDGDATIFSIQNGDKKNREAWATAFNRKNKNLGAKVFLSKPVQEFANQVNPEQKVDNMANGLNNRVPSGIDANNYIDVVWHSPLFKSNNVRAYKGEESKQIFQKGHTGDQIGDIPNSGADIALTKISINGAEVERLFPSLAREMKKNNKDNEKNWYVGLGNDKDVAANESLFLAGFPSKKWDNIFTNSGNIVVKKRQITKSDKQSWWQNYNSVKNNLYNNTIENSQKERYEADWRNIDNLKKYWDKTNIWKNNNNNAQTTYNEVKSNYQNYTPVDHKRGMNIDVYLQNSMLTVAKTNFKNEKHPNRTNYLEGGASGSLVINSRFEAIGLVFQLIFGGNYNKENPENQYELGNVVSLLKSPEVKDRMWHGSIKKDVIDKLNKEGLKSVVLNPNSYF